VPKPEENHNPANKLPYVQPRLTTYGDLRQLTKSKGGGNNDGASNTKAPPS
jgi:hypothetical protein